MVSAPIVLLVATPVVWTMLATVPVTLHTRSLVSAALVPSEYVPVAVKVWVKPSGIVGLAGLILIDTRLGVVGVVGGVVVVAVSLLPPPHAVRRTHMQIAISRLAFLGVEEGMVIIISLVLRSVCGWQLC